MKKNSYHSYHCIVQIVFLLYASKYFASALAVDRSVGRSQIFLNDKGTRTRHNDVNDTMIRMMKKNSYHSYRYIVQIVFLLYASKYFASAPAVDQSMGRSQILLI